MGATKENRIEIDNTLGRYLKLIREQHNYSQKQLAEHINVSAPMVGYMENAERMPTMQTLIEYAEHFALDMSVLVAQRIITIEGTVARHGDKTPHHIMNEYHLIEHLAK